MANVVQFRDYQNRRDIERLYAEAGNNCAIAASVALISSEPLGKPFEDVLFNNLEQLYLTDTSPSEMNCDSGDCA